jgi:uncharacterized protein YndB with AHSA1/START domain
MIDAKEQISAVRRTTGTRDLAAGEAQVQTISQVYDTDLDDLWEAVTSAERIPRWFLPITGELKEGGHYQLEGNAGGTITTCDKPRWYAATWEYDDTVSWIEVRLTPEGAGRTRFELTHIAHTDEDFWNRFGPSATGLGWDLGLFGLAGHLADPAAALDPKDAMAWMQSDDGKLFLRLSADRWAAAYVADGADPETAKAMSDRGYEAYTAT